MAESLVRKRNGQRELLRRTFLLADPSGTFNSLLRSWFEATDGRPRFESAGTIDGVKIGVNGGQFIGVLRRYAVAKELAAGEFHHVTVDKPLPVIALRLTIRGGGRTVAPSALHDMIQCIEMALESNPT